MKGSSGPLFFAACRQLCRAVFVGVEFGCDVKCYRKAVKTAFLRSQRFPECQSDLRKRAEAVRWFGAETQLGVCARVCV